MSQSPTHYLWCCGHVTGLDNAEIVSGSGTGALLPSGCVLGHRATDLCPSCVIRRLDEQAFDIRSLLKDLNHHHATELRLRYLRSLRKFYRRIAHTLDEDAPDQNAMFTYYAPPAKETCLHLQALTKRLCHETLSEIEELSYRSRTTLNKGYYSLVKQLLQDIEAWYNVADPVTKNWLSIEGGTLEELRNIRKELKEAIKVEQSLVIECEKIESELTQMVDQNASLKYFLFG
ncbi:hypothetical protein GGR57DRAFT_518792 [Xylariaceae sp. FL1272]|nr:hypothetical protein GGR57DRAFT_518792 [Xylariaceae sp. FL1272]